MAKLSASQVWDGQVLRLSFRCAISKNLMNMWYDLLGIVENLSLQENSDQIMWSFNSSGSFLYNLFMQ